MKIFILFTILLILHTACVKEDTLHLNSTDFEGKFLLTNYNEQYENLIYTADQGGLTQVHVFDSTDIINNGFKWIRNGQFIYYMQSPYCISCSVGKPLIIQPDGTLVRDFKSDFGYVLLSAISNEGNRLAFIRLYDDVIIYALDQEFHPILLDTVSSLLAVRSITWSPDGEKFLMVKDGEVAVYELSTRSLIPIFEYSEPGMQSPGWSADGSQVSFVLNNVMYIGNSNGLGTHPVTVENQNVLGAVWSNTTHELAYIRWSPDTDRVEMVIYDPSSETRTPLWETKALGHDLRYTRWQLEWSKDGGSIAFYAGIAEDHGLFIINRDGTNLRQIFDGNLTSFDWQED